MVGLARRPGNHQGQEAVVGVLEARDPRKRGFMRVPIRSIERQADIKRDALSLRFDLDARAADFPGSPVDADSHRCSFVGLRSTTRATHPRDPPLSPAHGGGWHCREPAENGRRSFRTTTGGATGARRQSPGVISPDDCGSRS